MEHGRPAGRQAFVFTRTSIHLARPKRRRRRRLINPTEGEEEKCGYGDINGPPSRPFVSRHERGIDGYMASLTNIPPNSMASTPGRKSVLLIQVY